MQYSTSEINIKSSYKYGTGSLEFSFKGKFTKEASYLATRAWANEFKKRSSNNQYTLIWDCSNMTGFDITAKNEFIRCLSRFEHMVSKVIVISDDIIIREIAKMMLQIFSFDVELLSKNDITEQQEAQSVSTNTLFNSVQPALTYALPVCFLIFAGVVSSLG